MHNPMKVGQLFPLVCIAYSDNGNCMKQVCEIWATPKDFMIFSFFWVESVNIM